MDTTTTEINEIQLDEKIVTKQDEPKRVKVIFLNDDGTPMEFVIQCLTTIYRHSADTAQEITLIIHEEGSGVVGVYTHEIAEQKAIETTNLARGSGFPLQIKLEEE